MKDPNSSSLERVSGSSPSRRVVIGLVAGVSIVSLLFGFVAGWVGSRRLVVGSRVQPDPASLSSKGDASGSVRTGVTLALRDFQQGYSKRDPAQLGEFMRRLFPNDEEILICGTDPGEWIQGRESAQRFIGGDWAGWGDLRLNVDDARISSSGDDAWLATTGTVSARPIRFLAVLHRANDRWLFRQIQFQWDASPVSLSDLLRPSVIAGSHLQ